MDMHKNGRCVYRIAETDACHCEKYVKYDDDKEREVAIESTGS
jgi:ferredoxin-thioredoxin reductase catalytic subunit